MCNWCYCSHTGGGTLAAGAKPWQLHGDKQKAAQRDQRKAEELLQQVRDLGRLPKENAGRSVGELQLDERVRIARKAIHLTKARKAKHFSPAQEAELQAMQRDQQKAVADLISRLIASTCSPTLSSWTSTGPN